jgi:SecD/SecF fusion protein
MDTRANRDCLISSREARTSRDGRYSCGSDVSDRKKYLLLLGLIAVALAAIVAMLVPGSPIHKKATLGLDLQGGLEVVMQAVPPPNRKLQKSDLDRSVEIMRNRVDKLGVSEPEIRKQGTDQIVIQLAGVHNKAQAAQLIGKTAQLEFYDLETDLTGPSRSANGFPIPTDSLYTLLSRVQAQAEEKGSREYYLFDSEKKKLLAGPTADREALFKTKAAKSRGITAASIAAAEEAQSGEGDSTKKSDKAKKDEAAYRVLGVPKDTIVASCGIGEVVCPGVNVVNPKQNAWYLFKYDPDGTNNNAEDPQNPVPEMTGADLKLSGTRADVDPQQGPIVLMQFTKDGARIFQDITKKEAAYGRLQSGIAGDKVEGHFAIVLDREIKSWPSIDWEQYPNGIEGSNGAQITGLDGFGEAKNLALVLQTGALPVNFHQIERTDVSATLGKDSLEEAKKAAIAGLILVALFLILVYRFLGVIAVIGLVIYAMLVYAAILLFNVTLTLPGFAGMVLTIGVAADANVVVFERIKEEVRTGKSVRAAIGAGYAKGFHTIVDANVVTCITALVLFAVATAGVKGFALMLLIGVVISLLTAVAATRAMLGLLAGFRWFDSPRFMGAHGTQGMKFLHIDYMRLRKLWFGISAVIIAVSVISLATRGLNLGIDFKGGTQITFTTPQAHQVDDVRSAAREIGQGAAQIQGRGSQSGDEYRSFQVRTESLSRADQDRLQNALEQRFDATSFGSKNVSSSFGRQIAKDALLAIFFSLFLVVLYLSIRFEIKFAIPVIVAMLHDVVITVGIFSLSGREVTTSTVAAVLTVLGYSIYDTIIIFDRIRENIPLMRRSSFASIVNVSLWETIRRSLATTLITLLPVAALFFFGGETLKDFAFALMIGIASGAYSSIFIAAPLLGVWKEREPEYARRKDTDDGVVPTEEAAEALLADAEARAAAEPAPELSPVAAVERAVASNEAKREQRRQRRRSRPHGRAR